jgi:probable addiction module antidote protein
MACSFRTKADIATYPQAVIEEEDGALFAAVLGDIARAHGMRKLAEETGISRQGLYNALSAEGNANLDTMLR